MIIVSFWTEYSTSLLYQISQSKIPNKMAQYGSDHHIVHLYRTWENIGGGKNWRIVDYSPIFYLQIISILETQKSIS